MLGIVFLAFLFFCYVISLIVEGCKPKTKKTNFNQSSNSKGLANYQKGKQGDDSITDAILALNQNKVPLRLCTSANSGLFLDNYETFFYEDAVKWASQNNCVVFSKVRICDIIRIDNIERYKLNRTIFKAISSRHFDFVILSKICEPDGYTKLIPRMIVEIDGTSHYQSDRIERDNLIDNLICCYNFKQNREDFKLILLHLSMKSMETTNRQWNVIADVRANKNKYSISEPLHIEEILNLYYSAFTKLNR
ncbi:MAG: DUF2726 domain-containing protein [Oscillospiraceae bacterium]